MTSPGGRIEIRVDPDLRGFGNRLAGGLSDSARTGVAAFATAAKAALLTAAVGIGAAGLLAARSTLNIGIEYQNQLNTLQAVSSATEAQMTSVGRTAKQLGSDLTLPATSAADAAAVMTELAKANFTVDEAQQAAKGSLQLAAAAQIEGAQAATIQANAINAYGLAATDATRVADVLANAANASSAEITDVADSLAQAAAVAASANISIEDTATVIGILANNGIRGSDAGTLLKSALLALQSPSKQARDSMSDLGLTAYDAQGNFVGLRSIFEQLQVAQGSMTQQQYELATSTLFGSDAARLAGIAAREGGEGFDVMATAIGRQGAAADVAAAKSRGLGGAVEAFKSQVETVQIDIFERAAPSLERLVRAAAERLPEVAANALETADDVVATFQDMAPRIGRALDARRDAVVAAWQQLGQPLLDGAKDLADKGLDVVVDSAERLGELAEHAVDTVEPLAKSVGRLASSLTQANGPLDTAGDLLGHAADAAGLALGATGPLVRVVGGAVDIFAKLPGPVQSAAIALGALKVAARTDFFGRLAGSGNAAVATLGKVGDAVVTLPSQTGSARTGLSGLSDELRLQASLADANRSKLSDVERALGGLGTGAGGAEVQLSRVQMMQRGWDEALATTAGHVEETAQGTGRLSAAVGVLGAQGGVVGGIGQGLGAVGDSAQRIGQAEGALGRLGQTAREVGTGAMGALKSGLSGAVGFLGGPWGVAITGAVLGLSWMQSAAQQHERELERDKNQLVQWMTAVNSGGTAAIDAGRKLDGYKDRLAEARDKLGEMETAQQRGVTAARGMNSAVGRQRATVKELEEGLAGATAEYKQQIASMSPLELAQQRLTVAQNDLNEALRRNPPNSRAVAEAEAALATAQRNVANETDNATRAQRTQIQAQQDATDKILAQLDAERALEQSKLTLADAIDRYNQDVASGTLSTSQLRQAQLQLVDTAEATARTASDAAAAAARQAGATDTAAASQGVFLQALRDAADQMTGPAKQAIEDMITQLGGSSAAAQIAAGQINQLGINVVGLPDGKYIEIDAPTDDQMQRLHDLGYVTTTLPNGHILVTADTNPAASAIYDLVHRTYIASVLVRATMPDLNGSVSGSGRPGLATGGYISGPGTGTSDSVPILASNGEYMHRAAVVALLGRGTEDALNRGDWQAALPRIQALADRQSRATLAATVAARQAGRYAAGGYVDAQMLREAAGVASDRDGSGPAVVQHVYASPGMDEMAVADRAVRRLESGIRTRRR